MKKMQPVNGNVLIEMAEEKEATSGGIIIPETAKEKPSEGKVISIAADATEQIVVGDVVIFKEYSGTKVEYDGTEYLLIPADEILAKYVDVDEI